MAHAIVEWTDNIEGEFDLSALLHLIATQMREKADGAFPVGGIRVRGVRVTDYVIADGMGPRDAFINVEIKMGVGRPVAFREAFFDALFKQIELFLRDLFETRPLALSLYVAEVEGWKRNSIHKRLEGKENGSRS